MQETEKAYLAGFIDADGCISIDKSKRQKQSDRQPYYFIPRMQIANRHYDLLCWLNKITGETASFKKRKWTKKAEWSDCWWLGWTSNPMREILPQIIPYLRIKRRQAEYVLEMLALKQGTLDLRKVKAHQQLKGMSIDYENKTERYEELWLKVRKLNQRGPEYLANNGVNSGETRIFTDNPEPSIANGIM